MRRWQVLVALGRDAVQLWRGIPDDMLAWAIRLHRPIDVAGDGSVAWCPTCRREWPCPEFNRLDDIKASR